MLEIERQCIETNTAGQVRVTQDTVTSVTITSTEMSSFSNASSQRNDVRSRLRRFEAPTRKQTQDEQNDMFSIYDLGSGYNEASGTSYCQSQYLTQASIGDNATHRQDVLEKGEKDNATLNTKLTQSTTPIISKLNNLGDDKLINGFATAKTLFSNDKTPEVAPYSAGKNMASKATFSSGLSQIHQNPPQQMESESTTVCPARYTLRSGNPSKLSRSKAHTKEKIVPEIESSSLNMDMDVDVDIDHGQIEEQRPGQTICNSDELSVDGEKSFLFGNYELSKPPLSSLPPLSDTQTAIADKPSEVSSISCTSTAGASKPSHFEHCPPSTSRGVANDLASLQTSLIIE